MGRLFGVWGLGWVVVVGLSLGLYRFFGYDSVSMFDYCWGLAIDRVLVGLVLNAG